jgi:hypothetical protein
LYTPEKSLARHVFPASVVDVTPVVEVVVECGALVVVVVVVECTICRLKV